MGHAASYPAQDGVRYLNYAKGKWDEPFGALKKWEVENTPLSTHLSNVRSFTTTFSQPAPEKPTVPPPELAMLRHNLLHEESSELVFAKTKTDCLDAVCDQLYVALGNAVACGFTAEQINRGLAEVHRSNMTKLWTKEEWAERDEATQIHAVGPNQYVVKNKDGKILKPPGYSPADLSWIEGEK